MRRDGFPAADRVDAFVRLCFQMNLIGANAQRFCQRLTHLREMRAQLGLFSDDHGIDMLDREMFLIQQLSYMFQENQTVRALPLWIRVRKMRTDVAKPRLPQQRIANTMRNHIAIEVSHVSFVKMQLHPANDHPAALGKSV